MTNEEQAKRASDAFREEHGLGTQPLSDMVSLIEATTGCDVVIIDAPPNQHGLTLKDGRSGRLITGVARSANPMRQRSTLAHELAHILFQDWEQRLDTSVRKQEEIRADAFARHLLVPIEGVRTHLANLGERPADLAALSSVVRHFLVSPAIAAIAMRDAGYVDAQTAKKWMKECTTSALADRFGWSDYYDILRKVSSTPRAPQGLVSQAMNAYAEGVVSAQTVATASGMNLDDALEVLRGAGLHPSDRDDSARSAPTSR